MNIARKGDVWKINATPFIYASKSKALEMQFT